CHPGRAGNARRELRADQRFAHFVCSHLDGPPSGVRAEVPGRIQGHAPPKTVETAEAAGDALRRAEMEHPADRHAERRDRKRRPRMPMHGAALRKPEMSGGRATKKTPRRKRKK